MLCLLQTSRIHLSGLVLRSVSFGLLLELVVGLDEPVLDLKFVHLFFFRVFSGKLSSV
jgi:hypothetical protein